MRRPHLHLGGALFWIFFVPYVVGVVIFLTAGIAPSVVKESGSLHQALHDYADDALLAESDVSIQFENFDHGRLHHLLILGRAGQPPVFSGSVVPGEHRATFRFASPPAGAYLDDVGRRSRPEGGDPLRRRRRAVGVDPCAPWPASIRTGRRHGLARGRPQGGGRIAPG